MFQVNLEEVDTDGAIREAAEEVSGDTRLSFLKKAGLASGAFVSGGAVLGVLASPALAAGRPPSSFGAGDIGILNFALTLEYLEAAFYNEATSKGKITDKQLKGILQTTTRDENAHVKFLQTALGSKAVKSPKFDFKGTTGSEKMFAATSFALENTGVHAYLGQAGNIKNPKYLLAAASILTVEARHSAAIGLYLKATPQEISPSGSFDTPYTAAKVLSVVKGTGFLVS